MNKIELEKYYQYNSIKNISGNILFSVCWGSFLEGINFNDDFVRIVILMGII